MAEQELATVKKPGTVDRISKEEFEKRILTIAQSKRDIVWWAENFFRIVSLNTGLGVIKLYEKQKAMLKHLVANDRNIILSSRQTGKCVFKDTKIIIRNKNTGEIESITVEDFYNKFVDKQINLNNVGAESMFIEYAAERQQRKFVNSVDIADYEILTDTGWKPCKQIHKTIPYRVWSLITENFSLKCADDHIVFGENMEQVFVKDIYPGQKIQTQNGEEAVLTVSETGDSDNMYDIELGPESNHRYYTSGILSHNTTTYTIFCMWMATLFPEKKIMICANKLQTAIEIMDRLRIAYEYLPSWIKPSILVYNKQEITFSNQSTIRAFATSSSASRGFSANCVGGSTKVRIRLFGFLKLTVPIRLLRHICGKTEKKNDEITTLFVD